MDVALLCYHKNAEKLYPQKWIDEYRNSILNQTYEDISIYELNYGGDNFRVFDDSDKCAFKSEEFPTFIHALNYLLDHVFSLGYNIVFNSNLDDKYAYSWVETQLPYAEEGYDIVSSNFSLKYEDSEQEKHYHHFENMDIKKELESNNNIIGHPGVCYSRKFWEGNRYVPEQQPYEDMKLWQRSIDKYRFKIVPQHLFEHRIHNNAVCRSENK